MKFTGQSKDGVVDNLLRAYVSRPSNPRQACPEFDPDRANAYIERSLTGPSRSHYEQHLSGCAACRKNVVALVRLADADALASGSPARERARSTWFSGVKQAFSAMSQPQWAMAAVAVVVLAISLPLVLSRNWSRQDTSAVEQAADNRAQTTTAAGSPDNQVSGATASLKSPATADRQREKDADKADEKSELIATNAQPVSKPADALSGIAAADASKKQTAKGFAQPVDEVQAKSEGQVKSENQATQTPAQAGAGPGSQLAKNESAEARQQQPDKDAAQQVSEPKPRADQESSEKEKTRRAEEAAAPPAAPSAEAPRDRGAGALRRSTSKLALRDSNGEAVRVDERKISGRKFLFRDGAWTDKDFDPNKDLPIVTIIRDSNVYKELLSKRSGLRAIMERFTPAERAIIVYKGTVYKLIPQQGDK